MRGLEAGIQFLEERFQFTLLQGCNPLGSHWKPGSSTSSPLFWTSVFSWTLGFSLPYNFLNILSAAQLLLSAQLRHVLWVDRCLLRKMEPQSQVHFSELLYGVLVAQFSAILIPLWWLPWVFSIWCLVFLGCLSGRVGQQQKSPTAGFVSLARPTLGTWPANQACALTGNQTGDPLVRRPALNSLSHTSQGRFSNPCFDIPEGLKGIQNLRLRSAASECLFWSQTGLKPQGCHFPATWPWTSDPHRIKLN